MSEYSRAPSRGHRAIARERAMQVDRQPSPWPCVAMLAGLLFLCLMAPRYWQNMGAVSDPTIGIDGQATTERLDEGRSRLDHDENSGNTFFTVGHFDFSGIDIGGFASGLNSDLSYLGAPLSIEELIATRTAMSQ